MKFNNRIMYKVWDYEQEILDVIHDVCIKNHLKYSIFYGTLLGAVRHGGFIPWDDDIDIIMPREDYRRLLEIWNQDAPEGYLIQDYHTDLDNTNNFAKVRKDNTTYLQNKEECLKKYHKGIFVDIFPADRQAPNKILAKLQYIGFAVNLLYSRGYNSESGGIIGIIEKILLNTCKKKYVSRRDAAERFVTKWNGKVHTPYICSGTIRDCEVLLPEETFDNLGTILFKGKEYFAVSDPIKYLEIIYGDFMKLPPESERVWSHHPILIDFNRNFEEIPTEERESLRLN